MSSSHDNVSMALFCDFENVALGVRDANYEKFDIRLVLERLLLKGSIVIKKAYCDWDRYKAFKAPMHEANFELIEIPHVRQSGKNSADIRLVVDALDLCYTKSHLDTFVIISGDSDFSPLVSKLRENAKHVIGVGVKQSTSDLLIANCDEFIFYDDLVRENARSSSRDAARDNAGARRGQGDDRRRKEDTDARKSKALDIAVETFEALLAERGDTGKIWASALKDAIKRRKPDFNESYYGFRAFGNLLEEAQARGLLDVGRDEKSGTYVYRAMTGAMETAAPAIPASDVSSVRAMNEQDAAMASAPAAQAPLDKPKRPSRRRARGAAAVTPEATAVTTETAAPVTPMSAAISAPEQQFFAEVPPRLSPSRQSSSDQPASTKSASIQSASTQSAPTQFASTQPDNAARTSRRGRERTRATETPVPTSAMDAPLPASAPDAPAAAPAVSIQVDPHEDAPATPAKAARKAPARPRRARKTTSSTSET